MARADARHSGGPIGRGAAALLLLATLGAAAAMYVPALDWGLPSWTGWAPDEMQPSRVREPLRWPDKYPPLHRYLLIPVDAAVAAVVETADGTGSQVYYWQFVAHRLVSTLMALGIVGLTYRAVRVVADRRPALLAALVVAPTLPLVYYAKTANLDVPYVFWFALSMVFLLRALTRAGAGDYLGLGLAAALAITTKDQAYGLYVALPPVLLWDLARRRRERGRRALTILADVRPWLAGGGVVLGTLGIWWAAGAGELGRHVDAILGGRGISWYRVYPATLGGQWDMALDSARYVWLAAGPFACGAAALGLVRVLARPGERRWGQALALVPLGYYASFVAPLGYSYVRFLLPLLWVLALFAGLGLDRVVAALPWRAWAAPLLVVGLAWPVWRAVSLNLHMRGDARYAAQEWLEAEGGEQVLSLGHPQAGPRGVQALEWHRLSASPCRRLDRVEGLVVNLGEVRGETARQRLAWIDSGFAGFAESGRFGNAAPAPWLHRDDVSWNLDKIADEVVVYSPTGEGCYDPESVRARIAAVRAGTAEVDRRRLGEAIRAGIVPTLPLWGRRLVATGLADDRWTRGAVAVAIVAAPRREPWTAAVDVLVAAESGGRATVWIDGERGRTEHSVAPGRQRLTLGRVAANEPHLWVLWSDVAWTPPGSRRVLGVRLLPAARQR